MKTCFRVHKVAVLGAGVMGAQIAAHLVNAGIDTLLFDLSSEGSDKSATARQAISMLKNQKPAPMASEANVQWITPFNYDEHIHLLKTCDLVIEAIAERVEWKTALYERVAPHLASHAVLVSNTSGLSINLLAAACPRAIRPRFCGVHFFNPPRYMPLVELIAANDTDPTLLDEVESFLVTVLGKGVIRAKDTPNFIANRIGVFSLLSVIYHAEKYQIPFEVIDELTGVRIQRPKSATFRTADVVGLDTFIHVLKTMQDHLKNDPWHAFFTVPSWLKTCVEQGKLGAKTKAGIYKKEEGALYVLDPIHQSYRLANKKPDDEVKAILKIENFAERFRALRACIHPEAKFLWAAFRDVWHYIAYHFGEIAHTARDIDLAMRWGYGWKQGPLEIWQAIGWQEIAEEIQADIEADKTMAKVVLPKWVFDRLGVYAAEGSYSVNEEALIGRSTLSVYKRQLFPPRLFGEGHAVYGKTCYENAGIRMWTMGDGIAIISFKTKQNCISDQVLQGINAAITQAEEENYRGIVLWQPEGPFSVGADLSAMGPAFMTGDWQSIEKIVELFQQTSLRIRYSKLPVVAAVQSYAFGGGCEFVMHADRVVASLESYMGLVEVGVGLLPAGGGGKEFALRASHESKGDLLAALKSYYMMIATAKVATSARQAQEMGYLRSSDIIILNPDELLYVAKTQVIALSEAGYRPPLQTQHFPVAGRDAAATIRGQLINMQEGGFISKYDRFIAETIADIITGGEVEPGTLVDEAWILKLEREGFMRLLKKGNTQERILSMLEHNKPLRN